MATFINPYNFVRPGKPSERKPYVSHKKFAGLSGVIECHLTTLTPVFTPDPKTTQPRDDKKRDMKFFRVDGKPGIPASSLKGMIRSVAEAASNSCFSVFDVSEEPGSYMIYRDVDPKPAGIMSFHNGKWIIKEVEEVVIRGLKVSSNDEDTVWFQDSGRRHRFRRVANQVSHHKSGKCSENGILKEYRKGILGDKGCGFRIVVESENAYEVSQEVVERYYKTIKHPEFASEEIKRSERDYLEKLDGSFVYFRHDSSSKVESFGKNFRYKWLGKHTPAELLRRDSPDFLPCQTRDRLCMCCRIFGTVGDGENQVAGRITFTDARSEGDEPQMIHNVRLRILGQPRPKYYPFYLIGTPGTIRPIRTYDHNESLLRGRKFYWHYPPASKYYEEPQGRWNDKNARVELLPDGVRFSFAVEFVNLDKIELGLLLYSLELDEAQDNMAHKLGMGKPIGLGSVKISIDNCIIESSISRYGKPETETPTKKDDCVRRFKEYMTSINGADFDKIQNISDLRNILNTDNLPSEVAYPPVPKGDKYRQDQGFGWFMEDGKRSPLPTSTDVRNDRNTLEEKYAKR